MCLHSMVISAIILKLIDDILVAVDMKLGVVILIIELSAPFDIVDITKFFGRSSIKISNY